MELSLFDGNEDAYWWILCTKSYLMATGKSDLAKMTVVALTMRGHALRWWLWWSRRHPESNWLHLYHCFFMVFQTRMTAY